MNYFKIIKKNGLAEILKRNIIVLHGEQEILIEEILTKIIGEIIDNSFKDFDYVMLNSAPLKGETEKSITLKDVIEELEGFPFGSKKKIVALKGCAKLSIDERNRLAKYVTSIPSSSILILLINSKSALSTLLGSKLEKSLKKNASIINCTIKTGEIVKWIVEYAAKSTGKTIEPETGKYLLKRAGSNLRIISSELNKLSSFVEPSFRISKEDIDICTSQEINAGVFDLVDAVGTGQTYRALKIFSDLMKQNEEPLRLLALLSNYINLMKQVSELKTKKIPPGEIISLLRKLGEHPFRIQKALESSFFSLTGLQKCHKWLLEADISIKMGRQTPELVMELLIIILCQEAKKKKKRYVRRR